MNHTVFPRWRRQRARRPQVLLAILAVALCSVAQAAGVLLTTDHPTNPQPLRWDTSKGPIQVTTDIGNYVYKDDGSVFMDNAAADRITAFALQQWSNISSSTWKAVTDPAKFKKFKTDVVDGATASQIYGQPLDGGLYVIYDQTGAVIEEYFGAPRDQVLGIAFAEFGEDRDGDGYPETIIKATAVMNGYAVSHESYPADQPWMPQPDIGGKRVAGVFTHEFGHAINLSHSQVNGQLAYFSVPGRELAPGVPGCVAPSYRYDLNDSSIARTSPQYIETMFPFIDPTGNDLEGRSGGQEQSTVDRPDDIAGISNLYPTAAYLKNRGAITGTLYLKDRRTPYGGINIIARNVANPLGDAVSAMTGDQTQGKVGPDGRFRISNLTPGQQYVLYTEEIIAGGYPTNPTALVSQAEYWNSGEQTSVTADNPCLSTPIVAEAGVAKSANFYFNGYLDGVQYTPITYGILTSMAKDGRTAAGIIGGTKPFVWDAKSGVTMSADGVTATNTGITRDGRMLYVQADLDGKLSGIDYWGNPVAIDSAAIWDTKTRRMTGLGSLNGDTCGGESETGYSSSVAMGMDDSGKTVVGLAYIDRNGDHSCQGSSWTAGVPNEIVPMIWTEGKGMRQLSLDGVDFATEPWHRAHSISGNGRVVLGTSNLNKAYAWIDEGKPIDLYKAIGASDGYAVTPDGSRAGLLSWTETAILWNPKLGTQPAAFTKLPQLKWCSDLPFNGWWDSCDWSGADFIQANYGPAPVRFTDFSDDGKMGIGRAGSPASGGFTAMLWFEELGWIKMADFFRTQGVAEAFKLGLDIPTSLSGKGNEMVGTVLGSDVTWYVDMSRAFVCKNGRSQELSFPSAWVNEVKRGALMGRCEHL
jgi:hypothetical protein